MAPAHSAPLRFAMAKSKKKLYSRVQAVKATARASVGMPPPGRVLPDPKKKHANTRSKPTLAQLLSPTRDEESSKGDPR